MSQSSTVFNARVANLAAFKIDEAKTICRRKIETVASTTDQLNHTPEEAAVFKPWCAAVRENYQRLKSELAAVGATWNPVETPDQEAYDAKDIGYNEALAAIDIHAGWPEWGGLEAALDQAEEDDNDQLFSNTDDISEKQALEAQLAQREEELALANERIAELESREPEVRIERVEVERIVERVVEVSSPEAAPLKIIPDEIAAMMDPGDTFSPEVRRKLTERLNVELAELKNLRGLAGEDLKREAKIENLLGLFARLGEI